MKLTILENVMTPEGIKSMVTWEYEGRLFCAWDRDAGRALAQAQLLSYEADGGLVTTVANPPPTEVPSL